MVEMKNEYSGRDEYIKMLKRKKKEQRKRLAKRKARALYSSIRGNIDTSGKLLTDIGENSED